MSTVRSYPLNTKGRDFVLGGIHGAFDMVIQGMRQVKFNRNVDRLFSVGDWKVIDDAQGYGYKSAQSAHKAAAYKFKGGKQKADAAKAFWRQHKEFARKLSDMLLNNFKEPPSDAEIVAFAVECGISNFNPKFVKALP